MKAMLFDIQKGSYVDGPGIRTTVFFKGCNLDCKWCHNPESKSADRQMLFYSDKCTGCGKCVSVCPNKGKKCELCGKCALFCPRDARKLCGREYGIEEVMRELLRDKCFYENSGGGVTFSGGECMLQIDFLSEILRECKTEGIHTAVDTAGNVPFSYFERILPFTDLFLYDIKAFSAEKHKEGTGADNARILKNAKRLSGKSKILFRIPVIGGFNDEETEMQKIADFLKDISHEKVELLPYHALGEHKYRALGVNVEVFSAPSPERMKRFRAMFERA